MAFTLTAIFALLCSVAVSTGAETPTHLTKRDRPLLPTLGNMMLNLSSAVIKKISDAGYFTNQQIKSIMGGAISTMNDITRALFRRDSIYDTIMSSINNVKQSTDNIYQEIKDAAKDMKSSASKLGNQLMNMVSNEIKAAKNSLDTGLQNAIDTVNDLQQKMVPPSIMRSRMMRDAIQMQYAIQELEFLSQARRFSRVLNRGGFTL